MLLIESRGRFEQNSISANGLTTDQRAEVDLAVSGLKRTGPKDRDRWVSRRRALVRRIVPLQQESG